MNQSENNLQTSKMQIGLYAKVGGAVAAILMLSYASYALWQYSFSLEGTKATAGRDITKAEAWVKENRKEYCEMTASETLEFASNGAGHVVPELQPQTIEGAEEMTEHPDPVARITGMYLKALVTKDLDSRAFDKADESHRKKTGKSLTICKVGKMCTAPSWPDLDFKSDRLLPKITEFAIANPTPSVYAAALRLCNRRTINGCADLSFTQWAAIEPDNGIAWLSAANEAKAKNDRSGVEAALQNAAKAKIFDHRRPNFAIILETSAAKNLSPVMQAAILKDISKLEKFYPQSLYTAALQFCSRPVAGTPQFELCTNLAAQLKEKDRDYEGLSAAGSIGESLGWNAAVVANMKGERNAVQNLEAKQLFQTTKDGGYYDCPATKARLQIELDRLSKPNRDLGEILLKKSGKTISELSSPLSILF